VATQARSIGSGAKVCDDVMLSTQMFGMGKDTRTEILLGAGWWTKE
jgi:hypothetical protein